MLIRQVLFFNSLNEEKVVKWTKILHLKGSVGFGPFVEIRTSFVPVFLVLMVDSQKSRGKTDDTPSGNQGQNNFSKGI